MVDVEGSDATRYRCPPGTLGAGDWTNVMGSTCNLGPGRDTVSDITQATSGAKPKAPKRGGLRDRAVGVLDRFAERARPQEDLERRRSILTPSRTPEGSTSGRLPDRRRIQIDKPENLNPPTGANRAVAAATDDAKKKNIKNNGKGIAGNQFGQNFGKEDAAKKQAVVSAESFNRRVFIVKNDNGAARPYRVVDEDRARSIKNGSIIGVVTPDGKHRSIDAADFSPSDAIDELDKDPNFGKPMGPNGPSGPKTPKPKMPSEPPEDRSTGFPSIQKDLTEEERNGLESERRQWDEIRERQREITDSFADSGSVEDIQKIINKTEEAIERTKSSQANFLKKWREGDNTSAADYHGYGVILEQREAQLSHAKSALERAKLVKKNLSEAREEADRLQREQEEAAQRAAEQAGVNPPEPKEPRTVGVGEIFEKPKPAVPTIPEPQDTQSATKIQAKDLLDPNVIGYKDDLFDVTHGNTVENGFNIPTQVSVGNMGINDIDDALNHLVNGGSLDDVPDEFLRDAIMGSVDDQRFLSPMVSSPRFKLLDDSPGGGINAFYASGQYGGTFIVEDSKTGRKYIVKSPTAFPSEFVNEIYGQYLQQLFGTHAVRIRVSGYDQENSGNGNLPLIMEHFGDVVDGQIGDGETWDSGEFFLADTSFDSLSKEMILLMDSVMDNPDRHFKNWLFTEFNGENVVLGIDNGASGSGGDTPLPIPSMKRLIESQTKEVQDALDKINIERALAALDSLEENLVDQIQRHDDPLWVQSEVADLAVTRIRNFLSALEEIQNGNS